MSSQSIGNTNARRLVLGVDLGTNSLGTALIDVGSQEIVHTGVRVFAAGLEGDFATGKEESLAVKRRQARQQRRQTDRRRRRLLAIYRLLQRFGLLPEGDREQVLPSLDAEYRRRYPATQTLPYFLRARALDHRLEPFELGRALYHLAQRRGFRGRIAQVAEKEEEGSSYKAAIEGLWRDMENAGARTLGEYLAGIDPHQTRIRDRRTARAMYEREFDAIWAAQQAHHAELLTNERRSVLRNAFFFQRPLKPVDRFIGDCDLEKGEKRAPLYSLAAQTFRVLSSMNNLRVILPDGQVRELHLRERDLLLDEAEKQEKLTVGRARKLLGLPGNSRFSIEEDGEKNLPGNITAARVSAVLGSEWLNWDQERREDLVEDLGNPGRFETDEDLRRCLDEKWRFGAETAEQLLAVKLPAGYGALSRRAIGRLVPLMRNGMKQAAARKETYGEPQAREPVTKLPPVKEVKDVLGDIRNPAVLRSLSELRKTVNAIVARWGTPESIRIELGRDLRRGRAERQAISRKNRQQEVLRVEARRELEPYCGKDPKRLDIDKYLLWKECGARCPYTGRTISLRELFGDYPQYDIEHIVPLDRSLDDSFQNKTLCHVEMNKAKGNRTPWEAFGHLDDWMHMVNRVKDFKNRAKLERFTMTETDTAKLLANFSSRQLSDTRYASRLAAAYLGLFYGITKSDNRRIITCAGAVTAILRQKWDLNRILSESPEKNREDHRHHAVDAAAVAMVSPAQIKALADAASRAAGERKRRFGSLAPPWESFREDLAAKVKETNVSHRPKRRLRGALHEESLYSPPVERDGRTKARIQRPVDGLKAGQIEDIVDPTIRQIVREAIDRVGGDAKKLHGNWPVLVTRKGDRIPIKKVRCWVTDQFAILPSRRSDSKRSVIPGGNHHCEILAELDARTGRPSRWRFVTVSRLEASERYRNGGPVVQRDHEPGVQFCFSLSEGDLLEARRQPGETLQIWLVRSVRAGGQLAMSPASDARQKKDIVASGQLWQPTVNSLMRIGARKVVVTPIGEIIEAHD